MLETTVFRFGKRQWRWFTSGLFALSLACVSARIRPSLERFLDVSRLEAPDIDIDFCKERRGEVIDYVKQKYGEANVAQIGTFGTLRLEQLFEMLVGRWVCPYPR